jgi:F0F1-type ATP synthase assembly protein I
VEENKSNKKEIGPWWKPAVEIFSEVSTWIAVPIIIALIVGKALDTHYGTKPLMLLVCTGLAFLVSAFGIVRAVKKYVAKTNKNSSTQKPMTEIIDKK